MKDTEPVKLQREVVDKQTNQALLSNINHGGTIADIVRLPTWSIL